MSIKPQLPPQPYRLPLDREAFRAALWDGRGRALIHAMACGVAGLQDLVVDACLHHRAYDPQCEYERGQWLAEIAQAAGIAHRVADAVVAEMPRARSRERFWDLCQMCELAMAFARQGHGGARAALYTAFSRRDDSTGLIAAEQIVQLDGADGLLHVARTLGAWLRTDEDFDADDNPLRDYDETHGKGAALRVLEAAGGEPDVAAYLRHLEQLRIDDVCSKSLREAEQDRWQQLDGNDIVQTIVTSAPNERLFWLRRWGRTADDAAIRTVAAALHHEDDPVKLMKYLMVFHHRPMPSLDQHVLDLVEHPDDRLRFQATSVLGLHEDARVRSLAIERLKQGQVWNGELRLLHSNYCPEDHRLIEQALRLRADRQELHSLILDLVNLFGKVSAVELKDVMLFVYEHSPCSLCRGGAVSALLKTKQMPEWVRAECRYDVDSDTRSAVTE